MEKPNALAVRSATKADVFDGVDRVIASPVRREFERRSLARYGLPYLFGFESFIDRAVPSLRELDAVRGYDAGRIGLFEGRPALVRRSTAPDADVEIALDPVTKLPLGYTWRTGGETILVKYSGVTLDAALPPDAFAPGDLAGYREVATAETLALLAPGTPAPALDGVFTDGRTHSLAELTRGKAGAVLIFAGSDPASIAALESARDLLRTREGRDLAVVPVIAAEAVGASQFLDRIALKVPGLVGAEAVRTRAAYRVFYAPYIVVVDRDGVIREHTDDFDAARVLALLKPR